MNSKQFCDNPGGVLEVKVCGFKNTGSEFLPRIRFGEDGVSQGARVIATFFGVTDFEGFLKILTLFRTWTG